MSTLLYAERTKRRQATSGGFGLTAEDTTPTGSKWVDVAAALVPAEILALHAVAISVWTKTSEPAEGSEEGSVTTITDPANLEGAFYFLLGACIALYAYNKKGRWSKGDILRILIPPAAFVAWTMVQPNTAFDAAFDVGDGVRTFYGAALASALGLLAKKLADRADAEPAAGGDAGAGPARTVAPLQQGSRPSQPPV